MIEFAILLGSFVLSYALCLAMKRFGERLGLLAVPNYRSSHTLPVPYGGGVAIIAACLLGLVVVTVLRASPAHLLLLVVGPLIMGIVGYVDDLRAIPPLVRLTVAFVVTMSLMLYLGQFPALEFGFVSINAGALGLLLGSLYMVWLLNLFNFMDGIDGLAASQAVFVLAGALIITWDQELSTEQLFVAVILASTLGYLVINWPPAQLFMGDSGSLFLGLMLGSLSIYWANLGILSFNCWLILLSYFVTDASLTLLVRLIRSDNVSEAHSLHAYQQATRKYGSRPVLFTVLGVNIVLVLPAAWIAHLVPDVSFYLLVLVYCLLAITCWFLGAGREGRVE